MVKRSQVEEFYNQVYDAEGGAPGCECESGYDCSRCQYWVEDKMDTYDQMNNTQKRELVQDLGIEPKGRKKKRDRLM